MATNKAAVQAKIEEIESGVLNPASTVRQVLKDSNDSILEAVYSDSVYENTADTLSITEAGDFGYGFRFRKIAGGIVLSGILFADISVSSGATICTITDEDWKAEGSIFYATANTETNEVIKIAIKDNEIKVRSSVLAGELLLLNTFIYNSKN